MGKNFITIGTFDGVHLGHRHLMYVLRDLAACNGMESLILAFKYPPRVMMSDNKNMSVITLPEEKFKLLSDLNSGRVEELDFTQVRNISCGDFFDILLNKYNMGGLLVGKDFAFGKDRSGHLDFLRKACLANNILYMQADFVETNGHKISSSLIRKTIKDGDIDAVNNMLGRRLRISGKVVKGRQLGRTIGFPTANIEVDPLKILPRGVFAAEVILGKEVLKGVCNIGCRPTVEKNGLPLTEVHILDFDRDIYGKTLTINIAAKIRDEIKFEGLGDLVQQINKDAICAYKILK